MPILPNTDSFIWDAKVKRFVVNPNGRGAPKQTTLRVKFGYREFAFKFNSVGDAEDAELDLLGGNWHPAEFKGLPRGPISTWIEK